MFLCVFRFSLTASLPLSLFFPLSSARSTTYRTRGEKPEEIDPVSGSNNSMINIEKNRVVIPASSNAEEKPQVSSSLSFCSRTPVFVSDIEVRRQSAKLQCRKKTF